MRSKLLHEQDGVRTFAVVLRTGDEVGGALREFIRAEGLSAAQVTAIGAVSEAMLLFFDWERKEYVEIPVDEQCEVAAFLGDVALDPKGAPMAHIHLVLGKRDGVAVAGHLKRAIVRPTLEMILTETPAHLRRSIDPESGLGLIDLAS